MAVACAMATVCLSAQTTQAPLNPGGQGAGSQDNLDCTFGSDCLPLDRNSGGPIDVGGDASQWTYPGLGSRGSETSGGVYRDNGGIYNREERRHRTVAKPQPLTEFQMLVASSVGRILPIYGEDLFLNVPDTFAPVERIPVTPNYVIGPGDELLIRTWGQLSQNLHLVVDRSGSVYIPQIGEAHVAGLQFAQLQSFLKAQFDRVYRNFDLNVNMGQLRSIQVFITGEARQPGSYTISSLSTLANAIFACGGPEPHGSLRHVQLRRDGKLVTDFDLYDLLLKGDKSNDVPLQSGDVIYFPPMSAQIAVVGSVQLSAIYELRGNETVEDAIKLAGGTSALADTSSLVIERTEIQPAGNTARIAVDIKMDPAGLAARLENADLIRVQTQAPSFAKTVTLRGNVASPGRFAWRPGMHVRDLIPNKESLLTPGYWLRRGELGLPVASFQPMLPPLAQRQPTTSQPGQTNGREFAVPQDAQTLNSGLFPQLTEGVPADFTSTNDSTTPQYSSLAASEENSSTGSGAASKPVSESTSSSVAPATLGVGSRLITAPSFPIQTQVVRTSPDIDWSYAVIERTDSKTLTTRLIPFNLARVVIDRDESADPSLEPGDVITIFSDADIRVPRAQQTKYVRLEGEFEHAGVYSAVPGETLRQLVIRAGGLTPHAYLYGSQFSRESTRREQQQRLDEYVAALSYEIEIAASNKSTTVVSAQEAATAGSSVASQRQLVNSLRQARATGRIVLHIAPFHSGIDSLPDIPLEDGDRFIVPPMPSTVGIVGAVYDPNSFVYSAHYDAGDYLRNSGGPTRTADRHQIFIIRADGSVVSRQYLLHTLWTNSEFDREPMYPGDTIVVPEAINKTSVLRGLTDWSAVFSQFALGAAAIQVIK
jgi:protein involved in polysaccharide export with SLBB domain